jgi:hypothetical protein
VRAALRYLFASPVLVDQILNYAIIRLTLVHDSRFIVRNALGYFAVTDPPVTVPDFSREVCGEGDLSSAGIAARRLKRQHPRS